jgi:hypothetical protein
MVAVRGVYFITALALLVAPPARAVDLDATTFTDAKLGIRLQAPYGWILYRHSGYPSMLALAVAVDGRSTLGLSTELLEQGRKVERFVRSNCEAMRKVGLGVQSCGPGTVAGQALFRVRASAGEVDIDQVYLARGRRIFVLTLSSPRGTEPEVTMFQIVETLKVSAPATSGSQENVIRGIRGKPMPGMGKGKETLPELEGEGLTAPGGEQVPEVEEEQPLRLDESPLPEGEQPPAGSQPASSPASRPSRPPPGRPPAPGENLPQEP